MKVVPGPGPVGHRGFFVGVLRTKKNADGESLVNIAAIQEFGATAVIKRGSTTVVVKIPARPTFEPVALSLRKGVEARIAVRAQKALGLIT